jgi:hypothetical protein
MSLGFLSLEFDRGHGFLTVCMPRVPVQNLHKLLWGHQTPKRYMVPYMTDGQISSTLWPPCWERRMSIGEPAI